VSINELFEKHDGEYLKFERVENPKSKRSDVHAFIRLDELYPGNRDMIVAAPNATYSFFCESSPEILDEINPA